MRASEDHLTFLRQRSFALECSNIFSEADHAFLTRYGCWMTALVTGAIQPISPAEERFLSVDRGLIEPETPYEVAWDRLQSRRQYEEQNRDAPHYRVFDAAEAFFPRSESWRSNIDQDE